MQFAEAYRESLAKVATWVAAAKAIAKSVNMEENMFLLSVSVWFGWTTIKEFVNTSLTAS